MQRPLFLLLFLFSLAGLTAQVNFEPGHIITTDGERVECLIRNAGWDDTPATFTYRLAEGETTRQGSPATVREFAVTDKRKYVSRTFDRETSPDKVDRLSDNRAPTFEKTTAFLEVIVEGAVTLYGYEQQNKDLYFLSTGDGALRPLVYKRYNPQGREIKTNRDYVSVLSAELDCESLSVTRFGKLEYKRNPLRDLIVDYHECVGADYRVGNEVNKMTLALGVAGGPLFADLTYARQNLFGDLMDVETDLDNRIGFRIGATVELNLGTLGGRISIVANPAFMAYQTTGEFSLTSQSPPLDVNLQIIEIPIGLRYYSFLNDDSKLFATAMYGYDLHLNSEVSFFNIPFEAGSVGGFVAGLGYARGDHLTGEIRYAFSRNVLNRFRSAALNIQYVQLQVGYLF